MGLFSSDDESDREAAGGFANVAEFNGNFLNRTIDQEAGVVLYMVKDGRGTETEGVGLAAVPLKDTAFNPGNESVDD